MNKLTIEDIDIEVVKKNVKNINLSVHPPDGRVKLSAPKSMDNDSIRRFVTSKIPWIKKHKDKFKNQVREIPKRFISGETHYFQGNEYLLNLVETNSKHRVEIVNNTTINLYIGKDSTKEKRENIMNEWYRDELKLLIPKYISKWEEVMNVSVDEWKIRKMKNIWGSCHIHNKKILINLELAKKDLIYLEYVIVHEMVHLLERYHNDKFRSYMDKFLPDWRNYNAGINRSGTSRGY